MFDVHNIMGAGLIESEQQAVASRLRGKYGTPPPQGRALNGLKYVRLDTARRKGINDQLPFPDIVGIHIHMLQCAAATGFSLRTEIGTGWFDALR